MAQHRFRDFKVRDDAILEGAHCDDVGRGAAEHPFGFVAHRQHLVRSGLHGDHRRFAQDNALILYVDERVGRPEIDADVTG
jgi:hypothetical protein